MIFVAENLIETIKEQYKKVIEFNSSDTDFERKYLHKDMMSELGTQLDRLYADIREFDDDTLEPILEGFNRRLAQLAKYATDEGAMTEELLLILLDLPITVRSMLLK